MKHQQHALLLAVNMDVVNGEVKSDAIASAASHPSKIPKPFAGVNSSQEHIPAVMLPASAKPEDAARLQVQEVPTVVEPEGPPAEVVLPTRDEDVEPAKTQLLDESLDFAAALDLPSPEAQPAAVAPAASAGAVDTSDLPANGVAAPAVVRSSEKAEEVMESPMKVAELSRQLSHNSSTPLTPPNYMTPPAARRSSSINQSPVSGVLGVGLPSGHIHINRHGSA